MNLATISGAPAAIGISRRAHRHPAPALAQLLRQPGSVPSGMGGDERADERDVLRPYRSPLDDPARFHGPESTRCRPGSPALRAAAARIY